MNTRGLCMAAICAAIWFPREASAEEPTDTADLDALLGESVSTTASKEAQASTAVPALTINITAEDLRRHGIRKIGRASCRERVCLLV